MASPVSSLPLPLETRGSLQELDSDIDDYIDYEDDEVGLEGSTGTVKNTPASKQASSRSQAPKKTKPKTKTDPKPKKTKPKTKPKASAPPSPKISLGTVPIEQVGAFAVLSVSTMLPTCFNLSQQAYQLADVPEKPQVEIVSMAESFPGAPPTEVSLSHRAHVLEYIQTEFRCGTRQKRLELTLSLTVLGVLRTTYFEQYPVLLHTKGAFVSALTFEEALTK